MNVEVATAITAMSQPNAHPPRTQMFPNGAGGAPNKDYVKVITEQVTVIVKKPEPGPNGQTSTTTGGSSTLDETLKKITDNVERTVEQKQVNGSGVGG
jgi:hypothetical protein